MSTRTSAVSMTLRTPPRVNLLPPELADRRRLRRAKFGLGLSALAACGVVTLLYLLAAGQVAAADADLAGSQAEKVGLERQVATYSEVPAVYAQVAAAESALIQAMGREVRWSFYLNDLALKIPAKVWMDTVTVSSDATPATSTASAAGSPTAAVAGAAVGQVTFSGRAFAHNDVAAWLDALAKQKGYADPYFSQSEVEVTGTRKTVKFATSVDVTTAALSGRYTSRAGG